MKRGILLLTTILTLCSPKAEALEARGACTTSGSKNKVFMKSQPDPVGYCGAFAFRALLHQHRCRVDPKNCALPSVVDILAKTIKHYPKDWITAPGYMLTAMQKEGGGVADENCLRFSSFWKDAPKNGEAGSTYNQTFMTAVLERMKAKIPSDGRYANCEYCEYSKLKSQLGQLDKVTREIAGALDKLSEDLNLEKRRFAEASRCVRRKIPDTKVHFTNQTGKPETLIGLLDGGSSVLTPLFIKEPDGKAQGHHAIVVTNYRQKCCAGACVRRYQVIDSLGFYWAPGATDGWVDEDILMKSLAPQSRLTILR
jgi:hypothetical protein